MRLCSFVMLGLTLCGAACTPPGEEDEVVDVPVGDAKADSVTHVTIPSSGTVTAQFAATGGPLEITVDCKPPADPDTVGPQFTATSAALGVTSTTTVRAGYWQWSGDVAAGTQSIKLKGKSSASSCTVRVATISGSCTSSSTFHSPTTGHTHITVGTNLTSWGSFPVSGNHWGAWSAWDTVYDKPVKHGFLLHNLEHGGIVLSYNCSSPTASGACSTAAQELEDLKKAFGEQRVIVTPDPSQPTRYAARAWRWGLQSSCFDQDRMLSFAHDRYRHGREDEDSDPPVPFDPSTTNVPCEDIMSAPDSCP